MMKRAMLWAVCVGFVFLMAVPVSAQSIRLAVLKGDIPFTFVSGRQILPAGAYTITVKDSEVRFVDARGHMVHAIFTSPQQENYKEEQPRLVFNKYADQYFLKQVWTRGNNVDLPGTRAEHRLEISLRTEEDNVVIAMR